MVNVLFIPFKESFGSAIIINLADQIKQILPESAVSVVVSLETYDIYYQNTSIDGYIVRPLGILKNLFLFNHNQYDFVVLSNRDVISIIACIFAGIRYKYYLPAIFTDDIEKDILLKLKQINNT